MTADERDILRFYHMTVGTGSEMRTEEMVRDVHMIAFDAGRGELIDNCAAIPVMVLGDEDRDGSVGPDGFRSCWRALHALHPVSQSVRVECVYELRLLQPGDEHVGSLLCAGNDATPSPAKPRWPARVRSEAPPIGSLNCLASCARLEGCR